MTLDVLLDGLGFAEGPRWHDDKLWFSDFYAHQVLTVNPDGLDFPNGTVITPDGTTLIVAETFGHRLTAYDWGSDGALTNQRVWAEVAPHYPDGICLDAEGAVWVSDPLGREVVRVREGGEIAQRVPTGDRGAYAC